MNENQDSYVLFEGDPGTAASIQIDQIGPNPYQPRRTFSPEKIQELTQSIKTYGLLQPIIVRRDGRGYQLVVGQRRLIACRNLGWKSISATVKDLSDSAMAAIALIENLQRENLNYFEESAGYARLMNEFKLTQEVLAQRLGKSQSTIANKMRLLKLPESVKEVLLAENLTERHARALLKLESEELQQKILQEIIEKGLTVSQTEVRIESLSNKPADSAARKQPKGVIRDFRIFLNTIREAVKIIERSGLTPEVEEKVSPEYVEVTIRLVK
jgi:ParB family transcriptional regulator, chromosome partitioning protein